MSNMSNISNMSFFPDESTVIVQVIRRLKVYLITREQVDSFLDANPTLAIVHSGAVDGQYTLSYRVEPRDINPDSGAEYGVMIHRHVNLGHVITHDEIELKLNGVNRRLMNEYE
jgi:hypothetical protein